MAVIGFIIAASLDNTTTYCVEDSFYSSYQVVKVSEYDDVTPFDLYKLTEDFGTEDFYFFSEFLTVLLSIMWRLWFARGPPVGLVSIH